MARETCNLNKEEAEILKPSPSSNPSPSPASPPVTSSPPSLFLKARPEAKIAVTAVISEAKKEEEDEPEQPVRFGNRCSTCRKRVGLTGFRCRCGDLFCGRHRYSDCHDCSFDYKAAGREEILKNNPVVRAAKIIKI